MYEKKLKIVETTHDLYDKSAYLPLLIPTNKNITETSSAELEYTFSA